MLELLEESSSEDEPDENGSSQPATNSPSASQEAEPPSDNVLMMTRIMSFVKTHKDGRFNGDDMYANFISTHQYSAEERDLVERSTREQANCDFWHKIRHGLITASNFKRVSSRVTTLLQKPEAKADALLQHLVGKSSLDEDHLPAALQWGRNQEDKARRLYETIEAKSHQGLRVATSGLVLSNENPFFACSPDGVVSCTCDTHAMNSWLIEIKCPYVLRDSEPSEAAKANGCSHVDGVWSLSEKHPYFTQIQGQLSITKHSMCYLVICTKRGLISVKVPKNDQYCTALFDKLNLFAKRYLFIHLLNASNDL